MVRLPTRIAHAVALAHHQRVDAGKDPAFQAQRLKSVMVMTFGRVAAGIDVVALHEEDEVAVDRACASDRADAR